MAAFADVVLRGFALAGQALAVGGVLFVALVLRGPASRRAGGPPAAGRHLAIIAAGALVVAAAQSLALSVQLSVLSDGGAWPLAAAASTTYFRTSVVRVLTAASLLALALILRRRGGGARVRAAMLGLAVLLVATSSWTGHAAGRLEGRAILLGLDTLHQLAAAAWIGGLVHLTAAAVAAGARPWHPAVLTRFSALALAAVAVLVAAGAGLSAVYVGGLRGLLGTAYGVMVLTKGVVLAGLLVLGALNFFAVRRLCAEPSLSLAGVRRVVEVELGLGLTVLFAAASLTSLPPAADVTADRATVAEVAGRFAPRWPAFRSPAHAELPVEDRSAPRTAADRAWSEYNHHVAGLFVLAMGLLATIQQVAGARWARHWPLAFLGLAGFLFVRNDPGAWPLGPEGFWASWAYPEVLQHRVFVLLVIAFGLFEWMVRTQRVASPRWAYVFPLMCAAGSGLLLTHSHAMLDVKAEFLTEITHAPLGVLGMVVAWGRWLEVRLPSPNARVPGRVWAIGFVLIGLALLVYRES